MKYEVLEQFRTDCGKDYWGSATRTADRAVAWDVFAVASRAVLERGGRVKMQVQEDGAAIVEIAECSGVGVAGAYTP